MTRTDVDSDRRGGQGGPHAAPSGAGMNRWRIMFGLAVTLVMVVLIWRRTDGAQLRQAFYNLTWMPIVACLVLTSTDYLTKILRWQIMLSAIEPAVTFGACARSLLASVALNNLLPLRAGDIMRAVAFKKELGVAVTQTLGVMMVERVLDMLTLLCLLAIVMTTVSGSLIPADIGRALIVLTVIGLIAAIVVLLLPAPAARVLKGFAERTSLTALKDGCAALIDILGVVAHQVQGQRLTKAIALTIVAWLLEAGVFIVLAGTFGATAMASAGLLAFALATLSTLIPSSPGYVGTFHFFAMQGLIAFGASTSAATAYAITVHLMLWLPTTLAGSIALGAYWLGDRRTPTSIRETGVAATTKASR